VWWGSTVVSGLYWRKSSIAFGVGGGEMFVRIGELEGFIR
jgi:hypothetical protein